MESLVGLVIIGTSSVFCIVLIFLIVSAIKKNREPIRDEHCVRRQDDG